MEKKLVSIITPSYNTGEFISKTINSVINQTYKNWEMIIVDDCSADNSIEIINNFSKEESRIILLKTKRQIYIGESDYEDFSNWKEKIKNQAISLGIYIQ